MTYFKNLVIIFYILIVYLSPLKANENYTQILSATSLKNFKSAIKEGNRKKWANSLKHLKNIDNTVAKKIIIWRWLIAHDGISSKNDLTEFYISNQNWPKINIIKKKIEFKNSINNFKDDMLWFQENPPVSGMAKVKLSELLIKNKFTEEGKWLLKDAWIRHTFSYSEEKYILKNFKNLITKEDHTKRIEKLIWNKSWGSTNRQLKRVPNNIKLLSIAKIKLSRRRGNVDNAIKNVPENLINEESIVYERIKWRRRARLEKSSLDLLLAYKNDYNYSKKWWKEINYHTRKQLSYGNHKTALKILKKYNNNSKEYLSEAQWLTGWLSLTFEKDLKTAYEYFTKMYVEVVTPISKARASYWAGKSAKTLEDKNSSQIWYERAAAFPATFYGQLALREINKDLFMPKINTNYNEEKFKKYISQELAQVLIILLQSKEKKLARLFAMHLVTEAKSTKDILVLSKILKDFEKISLSIFVGKKAIYNNIYIPSLNFPLPNKNLLETIKKNTVIPLPVTLAITRQESAFDISAKSRVGARGLMQVMPRTARITAKKNNYKYIRKHLTTKPSYNVKIGSIYFKEMLEKFNGSYVLALAAYNAGPSRVNRWLKTYGDPRKNEVDQVTWMELIPISETRNYVQRVIEGIYMYRMLADHNKNLTSSSKQLKLF